MSSPGPVGRHPINLIAMILLLVMAVPVSAQHGGEVIKLTSSGDIAAAASVNAAMDLLVQQAASCKTPGISCACNLKAGLSRLNAAYGAAIKRRPAWTHATVQYVRSSNGQAITTAIAFPAIRSQLGSCHVR